MKKNNSKSKINILRATLAAMLVLVIASGVVLGVGFGVYGNDLSQWFKPKTEVEAPQEQAEYAMVLNTIAENGIALMSSDAMVQNGVVSKVLTATVTPASSASVGFDWDIAFVNPNSEWAIGKNVTDYVTVTKDSQNDLKATVTFVQHFSEQIKVTVSCSIKPSVNASATVDCYKDILALDVRFTSDSNSFSAHAEKGKNSTVDGYFCDVVYQFTITPTYGEGTLAGSIQLQLVSDDGTKWTDGKQFQFNDILDRGYMVSGNDYPVYIIYNGERLNNGINRFEITYYDTPSNISMDETEIKF